MDMRHESLMWELETNEIQEQYDNGRNSIIYFERSFRIRNWEGGHTDTNQREVAP